MIRIDRKNRPIHPPPYKSGVSLGHTNNPSIKPESRIAASKRMLERNQNHNPMEDPIIKAKHDAACRTAEYRKNKSINNPMKNPITRAKVSTSITALGEHHNMKTQEMREFMSKRMLALGENHPAKKPENRIAQSKRMLGDKNPQKNDITRAKYITTINRPEMLAKKSKSASRTSGTPEARARSSKRMKENPIMKNPITLAKVIAIRQTPTFREGARIRRSKQIFPTKNTKPCLLIQSYLTEMGVRFEVEKLVLDEKGLPRHRTDIFLTDYNTCIEHNGCWWHGCLECYKPSQFMASKQGRASWNQIYNDENIYQRMLDKGHNVLYYWEHETSRPDFKEKFNRQISLIISSFNNSRK